MSFELAYIDACCALILNLVFLGEHRSIAPTFYFF